MLMSLHEYKQKNDTVAHKSGAHETRRGVPIYYCWVIVNWFTTRRNALHKGNFAIFEWLLLNGCPTDDDLVRFVIQ